MSAPRAEWQPGEGDLRAYPHIIAIGGRGLGIWKRTILKDRVQVAPRYFHTPSAAVQRAVAPAARRYGEFLGLAVEVIL